MNDWKRANYLNLSTQKRDGSFVNTPIWFAHSHLGEANTFYAFSEGKAGKVKRIRNFSAVKVCPCTVTGNLTGEWQEAEAEILNGSESQTAHKALLNQYGWQMRLLDLGSKLAGKYRKRAFLRLTLK
jgi:PPOX class probable F420-dependent enzyme